MTNVAEYTKQQGGTFLSAEIVTNKPEGVVWQITGEGEILENSFGKMRLHLPVKFGDKEEYIFDMSKTNAKIVSEVLGEDTKDWVGNALDLETYKTRTSKGEMTDAINVAKAIKTSEMMN